MFCTNCGKQIPDQAVFCPFCGQTLTQAAPAAPQTAPADAQAQDGPKKRKKSRAPLVIAMILAVILAAAGGVAAWYFLGRNAIVPGWSPSAAPSAQTQTAVPSTDEAAPPTDAAALPAPTDEGTPAPVPETVAGWCNVDGTNGTGYCSAARADGELLVLTDTGEGDLQFHRVLTQEDGTMALSEQTLHGIFSDVVPYRRGVACVEYVPEQSGTDIVWIDPHTLEKTTLCHVSETIYSSLYVGSGQLYFVVGDGDIQYLCTVVEDSTGAYVQRLLILDNTLLGLTDRGFYAADIQAEGSSNVTLYTYDGYVVQDFYKPETVYIQSFLAESANGVYLMETDFDYNQHVVFVSKADGQRTELTDALTGIGFNGDSFMMPAWDTGDDCLYILILHADGQTAELYRLSETAFVPELLLQTTAEGLPQDFAGSASLYVVDGRYCIMFQDSFYYTCHWQFY